MSEIRILPDNIRISQRNIRIRQVGHQEARRPARVISETETERMDHSEIRYLGRGARYYPAVYLMHTPDVTDEQADLAISTIENILEIAGVRDKTKVHNFGVWREPGYKRGKELVPHQSVDWYIDECVNREREQVDVAAAMDQIEKDPWKESNPHFDVVLTGKDLFQNNYNFLLGLTTYGRGTIISVNRLDRIENLRMRNEVLKTILYHEFGHVIGLPSDDRGCNIEENIGKHCTNMCVLRQGERFPDDWIKYTKDRLKTGIVYCKDCMDDLKKHYNF